jgi:hypothetical protein
MWFAKYPSKALQNASVNFSTGLSTLEIFLCFLKLIYYAVWTIHQNQFFNQVFSFMKEETRKRSIKNKLKKQRQVSFVNKKNHKTNFSF